MDRPRAAARLAPARQHARVALAGDDVRVRDDEPVARDPARALDAEPAGGAEHLDHARGRLLHLRVARDPGARRRDARLRPVDARERVERPQRVQQRPGRRQDRVEPLQDRGALDLHRASGSRRSARASAPRIQTTPRPATATSTAPSAPSAAAKPGSRASARRIGAPNASNSPASSAPTISAPSSPNAGAHGEREPSDSTSGPIRVPIQAPEREAGEREHAADEPLGPAEQRQQQDQPHDDPVDAGHRPSVLGGSPGSRAADGRMLTYVLVARARRVKIWGTRMAHHPPPRAPVLRRIRIARAARAPPCPVRRGWRRWAPPRVVAFAAGAAVGGGGERPAARGRAGRSPRRGSAATTPTCTRCSRRRRGSASRSSASPSPTAAPPGSRRCRASTPGRPDEPARRRRRGARRAAHAHLRHALGPRRAAGRRARGRRRRSTGGPYLVHPGLRRGETLTRATTMPPRAAIQARDGTPLAEGEARLSELGALASEIAGRVGPAPPERAAELARRGVPPGAPVGLTGLEREFDVELSGRPGGELRGGDRVLASVAPRPGRAVRTTIDPEIQRAAVDGARRPLRRHRRDRARRDGEVLALAGRRVLGAAAARLGLQDRHARGRARGGRREAAARSTRSRRPPCSRASSWRTPTASRAAARCATRSRTRATPSSRRWAPSWAPSGSSPRPSASASTRTRAWPARCAPTIPAAGEIGDDLAVGSTAIGQGKVLATPLAFAGIAGAIADGRRARAPDAAQGRAARAARARRRRRSRRTIGRYMRAVVTVGTGVGAAIPGVKVAGKTGTAELRDTTNDDPDPRPTPRRRRPSTTPPTRTRGSPPTPRRGGRAWRSACCSSARARAARRPRRRRGRCCRRRSRAS